jgi:hypothetical protein
VEKHGGTYYFFYRADNIISYNSGKPTKWMRVELTSGKKYHGHPVNFETVRKKFPKMEE